jgi:hypothetical protein
MGIFSSRVLRRCRLALVAGGAAVTATGAAVAGEPDCSRLTPQAGPLGYRARPNSDRCEGLYVARTAGGGIDVVSLTFGRIHFGTAPDAVLRLTVDTQAAQVQGLQLVGTAIPAGVYYRMEARDPAMPFRLPTAAVIQPAKIGENDLGIFAIRPLEGARDAFVPVHVSADGEAVPGNTVLDLVLRPRDDIEGLRWRAVVPGQPPESEQVRLREGEIATAGRRIDLAVTPSAPSRHLAVEVQYTTANDGQVHLRRFEIDMQ